MKEVIAKQWVDALRGGRYIQSDCEFLCSRDGYNTLGVLCDIAMWENPRIKISHRKGYRGYDGCYRILPRRVSIWAGMPLNYNGSFIWNPEDVGDDEWDYYCDNLMLGVCFPNKTFQETADIIERNYHLLKQPPYAQRMVDKYIARQNGLKTLVQEKLITLYDRLHTKLVNGDFEKTEDIRW